MRIEESHAALHHVAMDENVADALFNRATDLTYRAFGEDTTDEHIEWAYQRLVGNWRWGLGGEGVVTVH